MQPIIIEDRITVAANSTVANIIASTAALTRFLRAPFRARGLFMVIQSAAGLTVTLSHGSKEVIFQADPRVGTDIQYPTDAINEEWYCEEGEMLNLAVTNTTGGSLILSYRIILSPWEDELPPDTIVMQSGPDAITNGTFASDLLLNLKYSRPPRPCMLDVFMTASAAGLQREVYVDVDNVAPLSYIPILNRIPQKPFDFSVGGIEVPEDKQVSLPITNNSGGSLNVFWRTEMRELVRS